MNKKAYFFILDVFIAIGVVIVGLIVLFSFNPTWKSERQVFFLSEDISRLLTSTKIYELNNDYIFELRNNGNITDIENTVFEQVGEFYYRNISMGCSYCLDLAGNLIENITYRKTLRKYDFDVIIESVSIYNTSSSQDTAEVLVSTKKILFGLMDKDTFWGPYRGEVRVWK